MEEGLRLSMAVCSSSRTWSLRVPTPGPNFSQGHGSGLQRSFPISSLGFLFTKPYNSETSTMGGPNLEVFKFGLYLFVPVFALLHFGDPQWYHDNVLPVRLQHACIRD